MKFLVAIHAFIFFSFSISFKICNRNTNEIPASGVNFHISVGRWKENIHSSFTFLWIQEFLEVAGVLENINNWGRILMFFWCLDFGSLELSFSEMQPLKTVLKETWLKMRPLELLIVLEKTSVSFSSSRVSKLLLSGLVYWFWASILGGSLLHIYKWTWLEQLEKGQLVPLSTVSADAGCLARKQCELGRASRRTYGCWSRQRDHMGLWATEIPLPSCIQELLNKVQWKTLGRRAGIQAFPSQ